MDSPFPPGCAERFEAQRLLAHGGIGSVYLAIQRGLERPVAIKLLDVRTGAVSDSVERFVSEARISAALSHPHIVGVIDAGLEDGIPWIAYELVRGSSLRERITAGALPWREALRIAHQIAQALEVAHAHGIVHRDVKPENVLEDHPGHFKVTDFGVAKWSAPGAARTGAGRALGSPAYMAPEQIRGEPVAPSCDIYALGIVLYEMLTGLRPFGGPTISKVLDQHLESPIPIPSVSRADVPPAVDKLVMHALQKSPGQRIRTAADFQKGIEEITGPGLAAGVPQGDQAGREPATLVEALTQLYRTRRELDRHRALLRLYRTQSPGTLARSFVQVPRDIVEGLDPLLWVDRLMRIVDLNASMVDLLSEGMATPAAREELRGRPLAHVDRLPMSPGVLGTLLDEAGKEGFPAECTLHGTDAGGRARHLVFRAEMSPKGGHVRVEDITWKTRVEEHFSRYVGSEVLALLGDRSREELLRPTRTSVTLVIAAWRGFHPATLPDLPTARAFDHVDTLLDALVEVADRHHAAVHQFQWDGMALVCGAPYPTPDHAARGLALAIDLVVAGRRVFASWPASPDAVPAGLSAGVHADTFLVGDIGSRRRAAYSIAGTGTTIARTLNAAADADQIVMSQETFDRVRTIVRREPRYFDPPLRGFRRHGAASVPGLARPVEMVLYEPARAER